MSKQLQLSQILLLATITILALALRFYAVTINPPALYGDEVAIGYNAYSILKTGKDEWGTPSPTLFRSYDDYKAPLYIYTVAVFEKFFGPTDLAVRLPAVLSGTLTVLFLFFLTNEMLLLRGNKLLPSSYRVTVSLLASLLLAISPWHLQFSRVGFEASLALLFVVSGAWFFLWSVRKNIWLLFPSLILFSAATMTYHNARIFLPPFTLILFLLFWKTVHGNFSKVLFIIILTLAINLPYLPTWFSPEGRARLTSESILGQPGNLLENAQQNFTANFSLDYLFFHGDQNGRHSVKKLGELYLWQLPFLLIGLYLLVKKRSSLSVVLFAWLLLAAVPAAITKVSPHALRGFIMVVPLTIFIAIGTVEFVNKYHPPLFLLTPVVVFALALYLHIYYFHYPKAYAADWQDGLGRTVQYLAGVQNSYDQIFVHKTLFPAYILFYLPYDPATLQTQKHDTQTLGKYEYHDLLTSPIKKDSSKKSLIVAPPWMVSKDVEVKREIRMTNGDPVFEIYEF